LLAKANDDQDEYMVAQEAVGWDTIQNSLFESTDVGLVERKARFPDDDQIAYLAPKAEEGTGRDAGLQVPELEMMRRLVAVPERRCRMATDCH
jgi:hypothetical protein